MQLAVRTSRFDFRTSSLLLAACLLLVFGLESARAQPPAPATWYVKFHLTGNQDGTSWASAYPNLDNVFADQNFASGDQIWVAQGTYRPQNINLGFVVEKSVKIYGAFLGNETSVATRGGLATATILEGLDPVSGLNAPHVLKIGHATQYLSVLLDSVQIQHGSATGGLRGGGVYSANTDLDLTNCIVTSNGADYEGGGLYVEGPGTGIASTVHIVGCEFTSNHSWYLDGGAVLGSWVKGDILNTNFVGNASMGNGGALNLWNMGVGNPMTITDCVFWNNAANGTSALGGAVYLGGSSMSSFYGANATFVNCTMADNSMSTCGAGQAVYVTTDAAVNSAIYNSILAANGGGTCGTSDPLACPLALAVQYTDCWASSQGHATHFGSGNIEVDPLFRNHALAGGLTLKVNSPCIDAADYLRVPTDLHDIDGNGVFLEPLPLDFLFQRRMVDRPEVDTGHSGSTPGTTFLDMGAYEKP